jgi:hypothetical protein
MHTLRRADPLAQLWYRYDELDAHPIDDEDLDVSVDQQDVRVSEKDERGGRTDRPPPAPRGTPVNRRKQPSGAGPGQT